MEHIEFLKEVAQELVDTKQLLALVGDEAEMLVQAIARLALILVYAVSLNAVNLVIDVIVGSHLAVS